MTLLSLNGFLAEKAFNPFPNPVASLGGEGEKGCAALPRKVSRDDFAVVIARTLGS